MGRLDLKRPSARPVVRSSRRPRRAGPGDLAGIVALEAASFPPEDRFPRASWLRLLRSRSALTLVIPGPLGIDAAVAWLLRRGSALARMYSIAVHPRARGGGRGRALVAASLRHLPPMVHTLGLEVRSDNGAAVGLYCALGFLETARLPNYYGRRRPGIRMRAARATVARMLHRRR